MSYPSIMGCVNYRDPKSARDTAKVILIRLKQSSSLELAFEDELGLKPKPNSNRVKEDY